MTTTKSDIAKSWRKDVETRTNLDYFHEINREDKAYWLGFIYADGCLIRNQSSRTRMLSIKLKKEDGEHLQKFSGIFGQEVKYYQSNDRRLVKGFNESASFRLSSYQIFEDLMNKGIRPRKTFYDSLEVIDHVPQELMPSFIRGVFDGDGSVGVYSNNNGKQTILRASFCGTKTMMDFLLSEFKRVTLTKATVKKANSIYVFTFVGSPAVSAAAYMYQNASVFLSRKKEIFDQYASKHKPKEAIVA